jgi:hypothetical protein
MPIDDTKLAEIKAHNPDVTLHVLTNPDTDDQIVCKGPPDGEYKRFKATAGGSALERIAACRAMVMACLVYPPPEEWAALLAEKPGLAETFAGELNEIMGVSQRATHRKL